MNFERKGDIKKSMGIGVESYNPLKAQSSFTVRYFIKDRGVRIVQSLFGPESGHDLLRELEKDELDRKKLQKLFCINVPILEIVDIRFRFENSRVHPNILNSEIELPYSINYSFEENSLFKRNQLGRNEDVEELPVIFDQNLYFIKIDNLF